MAPDPVSLLTERQRQCLFLVHAGLEAKQIAEALRLSPHSVNEHLRDARRLLRVARSRQAARLFVEYQREHGLPIMMPAFNVAIVTSERDGATRAGQSVASPRARRLGLTVMRRLALIILIALGIMMLTGGFLAGADGIAQIFETGRIDISG
ncbi:MAG: hypothetical protein JWR80_584 [Bradyrhizobium sp.]|nr:hypothetical protein [Bradyrhizobium sp.]